MREIALGVALPSSSARADRTLAEPAAMWMLPNAIGTSSPLGTRARGATQGVLE